jgi:Histidyl-tRNA synthetase
MFSKVLFGFRDFYSVEYVVWVHIIDTWCRIVRRYACIEYDGPFLEPLELYI